MRPWSDLGASWQDFNPELEPSDVSAALLLMDGVLYMPPVETRAAGPHPYPESMRHGVFSVTKTLAMGLSMFYLAERYGEQLLSGAKVREALFRTSNRGLPSGTISRYLHSLRMIPVETAECRVEVIYMRGYGGNYVVMIPSGVSVIRFADADKYTLGSMVRVAERYRSSCR